MIDQILTYVLPATMALLPAKMDSLEARALLVAIGLQETRFCQRRQAGGGPARGFWQFEFAGVVGVLRHRRSKALLREALTRLRYPVAIGAAAVHEALEHNDVLAAVVARCLLWTDRDPLPLEGEKARAWLIYERLWRPGRPHRDTWDMVYNEAWSLTLLHGAFNPGDTHVD